MKRFILLSLVMAMFAGTLVACHAEGDVGHDTAQVMPGRSPPKNPEFTVGHEEALSFCESGLSSWPALCC